MRSLFAMKFNAKLNKEANNEERSSIECTASGSGSSKDSEHEVFEKYVGEKEEETKVYSTRLDIEHINKIREFCKDKPWTQGQLIADAVDLFLDKFEDYKKGNQ